MAIEHNTPFAQGAMEQPAIFVNRFQASVNPVGLLRLSAGEGFGKERPVQFRMAIACTKEDAIELANLILSLVQPSEASPALPKTEG